VHELGIAGSVLEAVRERASRESARIVRVGVRIGPLAGVDRNSLSFCFDAMVKGSEFEPLTLEVEDGASDELALTFLDLEDS
jgi:hydrogenase nickel incorporation protein HypA/HybF